jgi:multidrug transporter EmrE-like cation transporter
MLFILLRVLLMTLFAQLLRYSQARGGRVMSVVLVNYAFATLFCLALAVNGGELGWSGVTLACGVVGGTAYLLSLLFLLPAMDASGVAVSVAVLQLAVLVPVATSIVAFGERPSPAQVVGLVLAVAALVVLSVTTSAPAGSPTRVGRTSRRFSPLLVPLFFVTGLSGVAMKTFQQFGPPRERMSFNATLFAFATLSTLVAMGRSAPPRRTPRPARAASLGPSLSAALRRGSAGRLPRRLAPAGVSPGGTVPSPRLSSPLAWTGVGLVLGAVNAGQLVFLMLALSTAPAMIVFPVSSALCLVASAAASVLFWGEYLRPAGWLGLVLALAATVLLNMHSSQPLPRPSPKRGGVPGPGSSRHFPVALHRSSGSREKRAPPPRFGEAGRGSRALAAERTAAGAGPRARLGRAADSGGGRSPGGGRG